MACTTWGTDAELAGFRAAIRSFEAAHPGKWVTVQRVQRHRRGVVAMTTAAGVTIATPGRADVLQPAPVRDLLGASTAPGTCARGGRSCCRSFEPLLAASSSMAFLQSWNDFAWPLIALEGNRLFTLPVALLYLKGQYGSDHGAIMSFALLDGTPMVVLFLAFRRLFAQGFARSGIT